MAGDVIGQKGMSSWVSVKKELQFGLIREICRRTDCPIEDESGSFEYYVIRIESGLISMYSVIR